MSSWIVCKYEGGRQVAFVRWAGKAIVVTDNPRENAARFPTEVHAKSLACHLNVLKHHSDPSWFAERID